MSDTTNSTLWISGTLGALLVVVGVGAYVVSDFASVTALIPAVFGALVVVLALVALQTAYTTISIYGIALVAVVGVLGSLRGVPDILALLTGGDVDSTIAATTQGAMILVCLALFGAAVRYAVDSR